MDIEISITSSYPIYIRKLIIKVWQYLIKKLCCNKIYILNKISIKKKASICLCRRLWELKKKNIKPTFIAIPKVPFRKVFLIIHIYIYIYIWANLKDHYRECKLHSRQYFFLFGGGGDYKYHSNPLGIFLFDFWYDFFFFLHRYLRNNKYFKMYEFKEIIRKCKFS